METQQISVIEVNKSFFFVVVGKTKVKSAQEINVSAPKLKSFINIFRLFFCPKLIESKNRIYPHSDAYAFLDNGLFNEKKRAQNKEKNSDFSSAGILCGVGTSFSILNKKQKNR